MSEIIRNDGVTIYAEDFVSANGNRLSTAGGGGGAVWGSITGTLDNQTDLATALAGKQDVLGFTPEDAANKTTDGTLSGDSDTLFPSEKAVKTYVDAHGGTDPTKLALDTSNGPLTGDLGISKSTPQQKLLDTDSGLDTTVTKNAALNETVRLAQTLIDAGTLPATPDTYLAQANLDQGREAFGWVYSKLTDKFYLVCGNSTAANQVADVWEYDPTSNTWTSLNPFPVGLSSPVAVADDEGNVYVSGGNPSGFFGSTAFYKYDPATDSWIAKASMNVQRADHGSVFVNGRIYVFGGFTTGAAFTNTVEVYDPATDTWTFAAPMSVAKRDFAYALDYQGRIIVVGGYDGTSNVVAADRYDPDTNTWSALPNYPQALYGQNAARGFDQKVHVFGGYDGSVEVNSHYVLSLDETEWVADLVLPDTLLYAGVSEKNGIIYIAGGQDGGGLVNALHLFVPSNVADTNIWETEDGQNPGDFALTKFGDPNGRTVIQGNDVLIASARYRAGFEPLPRQALVSIQGAPANPNSYAQKLNFPGTTRENFAFAYSTITSKFYVFAGYSGAPYENDVWEYDPVGNTWTAKAATFPTARGNQRAITDDQGRIFVGAGSDGGGNLHDWYLYDPVGDTLTAKASFTQDHLLGYFGKAKGKLYLVSGYTNLITEEYDPIADTWTTKASLPSSEGSVDAAAGASVGYNGKLYLFGGQIDGGAQVTKASYVYDPDTDTWASLPDYPVRTGQNSAVVGYDNRLHIMGGVNPAQTAGIANHYILNADESGYDTAPDLPQSAGAFSAAVDSNGVVYWTLGQTGSNVLTPNTYLFVPSDTVLVQVWDVADSPNTDESGVQSFGDPNGRTVIEGKVVNAEVITVTGGDPVAADDLTRKSYVDKQAGSGFASLIATVKNIDFTTPADIPLFTVPVGKLFIPIDVVAFSDDIVGASADPSASLGITGPGYTDWQNNTPMTGVSTPDSAFLFTDTLPSADVYPIYPAGTIFNMKINTGAVATTLTGRVLVYGIMVDA